ncbi:hypothetical protein K4A83_22085 [Spirulina subsalsa FACHB-351]|uniref:Type II toxin-antitoxin system ParD family antitoxin n=1 Tax=Spirulina subsalsa FACHB-351 TaxID=234711 RepID=A0ABT3LD61_9CYAN|nr:hypothetical protein [Spirulina subsalsa]MCW6038920.1 hypothetical protein [Spirulina subsalsa FACHB-351]
MALSLTPELEQFVIERIASGQYKTRGEVVIAALQLLKASQSHSSNPVSILERMGGKPKFLLHQGNRARRDQRRQLLAEQLHQRYRESH